MFATKYHLEIDDRARSLAESENSVYLPNLRPSGPADYVFICMEPSLGRWAHSLEKAREQVNAGVCNFLPGGGVLILHFAAREFLPPRGARYHITDLSKGAMPCRDANIGRTQRYDRWFDLLLAELALVAAPGAKIFAVGNAVANHLNNRNFPYRFAPILHYSSVAAPHRARAVIGREQGFEEFKRSVSREHLRAVAEDVLTEHAIAPTIREQTLAKIDRHKLTDSLLQLAFTYKVQLGFTYEAQQLAFTYGN